MVVNWRLIEHPVNWLIIFMMLVIAGVAGHLLLSYVGIEPAKKPAGPASGQTSNAPPASAISSYAGR